MWAFLAAPAWRRYAWAVLSVWALGAPALAQADASVVVLTPEGSAPRAGFVQALRIQLAGVATVASGGSLALGTLGARVREASARATEQAALLSVWVESDSDDPSRGELVLYLVGPRDGRALVDVLRLPAGDEAAADRSLALKVREVFDTVADASAHLQLAAALAMSSPAASAPRVLIEAGAQVVPTAGTTGLPLGWLALAGPEWRLGETRVSGLLGARWLPSQEALRAGASVSVSELAPTLSLGVSQALRSFERLRLGAALAPGLHIQQADGRSALGRRGSAQELAAALLLQARAELSLVESFAVAFTLGVELVAPARRFAIDGQAVFDPGPVRAVSGLVLVLRL